jgi:hypothetical protein
VWVVSGWKTVRRAAGLRQNLIALLAYIYEPYSSRSKLFRLLWTPIRDVPAGGAGCGMAVLAMILTTGCTTRLIRRKSQGYARPAPARPHWSKKVTGAAGNGDYRATAKGANATLALMG